MANKKQEKVQEVACQVIRRLENVLCVFGIYSPQYNFRGKIFHQIYCVFICIISCFLFIRFLPMFSGNSVEFTTIQIIFYSVFYLQTCLNFTYSLMNRTYISKLLSETLSLIEFLPETKCKTFMFLTNILCGVVFATFFAAVAFTIFAFFFDLMTDNTYVFLLQPFKEGTLPAPFDVIYVSFMYLITEFIINALRMIIVSLVCLTYVIVSYITELQEELSEKISKCQTTAAFHGDDDQIEMCNIEDSVAVQDNGVSGQPESNTVVSSAVDQIQMNPNDSKLDEGKIDVAIMIENIAEDEAFTRTQDLGTKKRNIKPCICKELHGNAPKSHTPSSDHHDIITSLDQAIHYYENVCRFVSLLDDFFHFPIGLTLLSSICLICIAIFQAATLGNGWMQSFVILNLCVIALLMAVIVSCGVMISNRVSMFINKMQ